MEAQALGTSTLQVSQLAYGCMRLSGTWDRNKVDADAVSRGIRAVETAFDAGYTFFDHADIYGDSTCERIFGDALSLHPGWRDQIVIATKCGICFEHAPVAGYPHRYDFSYEHITSAVEGSLQRLQTDRIDLLMLHRPDFLADPEEICRAFTELRDQGKVHEFGVSNFRPSLVSAVQSALPFPLQVHQIEINLRRLEPFTDGTLDQCIERKITPMAWAPLDRGRLASSHVPDPGESGYTHHTAILQMLDQIAAELDSDRTAIALAWLLRHPSGIVPVIGSVNHDNIRNAVRATEVRLSRENWYRIFLAARGERLP